MLEQSLKNRVETIVAQIPEGRVMTYGQLAALAGSPRSARIVGGIAHFGDANLPWHRVVNKQGGLASGYPGSRIGHKKHLEAEGIVVNEEAGNYSVDVDLLLWWPQQATPATEDRRLKKSFIFPIPNPQSPILFIVGPTASGKSGLAMELARKLNGEIVCADSQTLRRDLDIGTAKPSMQDRYEIPHHLLDIINPYDRFSVNEFKQFAEQAIKGIQSRGKVPIVVGGSGLYIDALFFDFELEEQLESTEYKQKLENLSVNELQKIIKDNSYSMPSNRENPRHLIGVILRKGAVHENKEPVIGTRVYGILPSDEVLKQRISDRVDAMFDSGFIHEVEGVINKYGKPPKNLDAIGYPIGAEYLAGTMTLGKAKEKFKTAHWQYARRQKSWFKRNPYIVWSSTDKQVMNTIIKDVEASMNKSVTIES